MRTCNPLGVTSLAKWQWDMWGKVDEVEIPRPAEPPAPWTEEDEVAHGFPPHSCMNDQMECMKSLRAK